DSASPEDVELALVRFQSRNGLNPDGQLGADTLKALNVPASLRVQQIAANMERRRWMPREMEARYAMVNVPDRSVEAVEDGSVVLQSRVIIGKKATPTPILKTRAIAVVANPPWDLPDNLAAGLLPHLRKDPNYLAKRNMVLADGPADGAGVDWSKVNAHNIPFQIQQEPGSDNALGVLMLDMPNPFDVYMHDTPHKEYFQLADREKSNGCIRTEQIFPLASFALTGDPQEGADQLQEAVQTGQTQRLPLAKSLPIYVVYWTAIPQDDGSVGFRPDRYDRDKVLIAKMGLDVKAAPPAKPAPKKPASVRVSSA